MIKIMSYGGSGDFDATEIERYIDEELKGELSFENIPVACDALTKEYGYDYEYEVFYISDAKELWEWCIDKQVSFYCGERYHKDYIMKEVENV